MLVTAATDLQKDIVEGGRVSGWVTPSAKFRLNVCLGPLGSLRSVILILNWLFCG